MIPADVLSAAGLGGMGHGAREAALALADAARATGAAACVSRSGDETRPASWLVAVRHGPDCSSGRTLWWVSVDSWGRVRIDCPQLAAAISGPARRAA